MGKKISIITISYNSEKEIADTIQSVLDQSSPVYEYFIIDGVSEDRTVAVAESYREQMEQKGIRYRIVSEPDEGIYDAMNKGIRMVTGDVIGLINSGDKYRPEAAETAARIMEETDSGIVFSDICIHKANGEQFVKKARVRKYETSRDWNHPTMFVRADLYRRFPFRNKGIHDDYGFYLRMKKKGVKVVSTGKVTADFYMGGASNKKDFQEAVQRIRDRYQWCYLVNGYSKWYLLECILIEAGKWILG